MQTCESRKRQPVKQEMYQAVNMHRGSPYLSAGFKNNIHRKTHACNQTDFRHQNNCKWERQWQSPCNHICQVSNEELKLQSFGCQRLLTGGKYTCDDTQYIKSDSSGLWCYIWYIQRCLASVTFLGLQFVCLHMLCIRACVFVMAIMSRDQQASDPLTGKLYSFFGHSPWAARRLFLSHSLFLFTSSSILPVFTW